MSSQRHERISDLFLKACDLDPSQRRVFLDEAWKYYRREPVFSVNASDTVILGVYELDQPTAPFSEADI